MLSRRLLAFRICDKGAKNVGWSDLGLQVQGLQGFDNHKLKPCSGT